jgi:LysM repeat protein
LSAIRARNAELMAANQKLDEQARAAAVQSDAATQTKVALVAAEQRARQAEASLVTRQRERDEQAKALAAGQTSAAGLTAQIKKLGDEKTALAQANSRLEEQAQTGTRQAEQAERASKTAVAEQTQKLAGLTAELATARTGLVTAQGANADFAAQLKKLADQKALLTQQAARSGEAGQEVALLKTKLGQVESDLSAIRARNAELMAANQKLDEQARAAAVQSDAATQTKAALVAAEQRARQAEASLVTRQRERDELRQQLEAADRILAAAQTAAASRAEEDTRQFAELQLQLQQAKAELHSQNQSLHETSQRLEHEDKETADAVRQLAEAQAALEQMKREYSSLQAQRAALAARLAQEASAATALANPASAGAGSVDEVVRLKEELRRAEDKVEMTVRSFALARQENERLKAQIEQASTSTAQNHVRGAALAEANKAAAESASVRDALRQVQGANGSQATENASLKTAVPVAGGDRPAGSGIPSGHPAMEASSSPPPAAFTALLAPAPRTHRIVSGDTLTRISNRYYGTSLRWQDIYNANRDKLRSADVLPLDVELKIP